MVNGYPVQGFWVCPECSYCNMARGTGPYICEADGCGYQLDIDGYEGDEGDT